MKMAQLCPTLCDPMDSSLLGSSVHGISQQEYWSGLPFPSPGHLPNPGIKLRFPSLQADSYQSELPVSLYHKASLHMIHLWIRKRSYTLQVLLLFLPLPGANTLPF